MNNCNHINQILKNIVNEFDVRECFPLLSKCEENSDLYKILFDKINENRILRKNKNDAIVVCDYLRDIQELIITNFTDDELSFYEEANYGFQPIVKDIPKSKHFKGSPLHIDFEYQRNKYKKIMDKSKEEHQIFLKGFK